MEVRSTQDGILRAFAMLLQQQSQPRNVKKKFVYRQFGTAVHASRRLTKSEGAAVDALVGQLEALDPRDDANNSSIESLLKELSKQPVRFVPIKLEQRIDYSKPYPYRSTKRGG
ncbi:hypothetical protein [Bradyrhizobium ottawaense]|uniref:Uncharacterized protein n=1 Tax=Bradyrhizobium ottawaense TaxID=931866 RepID=A0ABY0QHI0_9BRAD|nr:hypothetical protein [Bradyrhizobium ottawaense]SDK45973.1 hypothetical protein SAMN05444163_8165 [Bradyrhizobium ottawaense]